MKSYKVVDLGFGQVEHNVLLTHTKVAVTSGQAFASLEHLVDFFYDSPFPEKGSGHVPLRTMSVRP